METKPLSSIQSMPIVHSQPSISACVRAPCGGVVEASNLTARRDLNDPSGSNWGPGAREAALSSASSKSRDIESINLPQTVQAFRLEKASRPGSPFVGLKSSIFQRVPCRSIMFSMNELSARRLGTHSLTDGMSS